MWLSGIVRILDPRLYSHGAVLQFTEEIGSPDRFRIHPVRIIHPHNSYVFPGIPAKQLVIPNHLRIDELPVFHRIGTRNRPDVPVGIVFSSTVQLPVPEDIKFLILFGGIRYPDGTIVVLFILSGDFFQFLGPRDLIIRCRIRIMRILFQGESARDIFIFILYNNHDLATAVLELGNVRVISEKSSGFKLSESFST